MSFRVFGILLIGLSLFPGQVTAQDTLRVILDKYSVAPFASVVLMPGRSIGSTDLDGHLELPTGLADTQMIVVEYAGYEDFKITYRELAGNSFTVRMIESLQPLVEVWLPLEVIGRRNEVRRDLPYQTELISRRTIARAQPLTSADALADLSGVYVQKSQFGGGSPVVRGFEANRVLLVVDGVRMNNAIYRNGHLQNAITVDPLALDKLEVIFGAGALAYGSDAVGGVIHFRTQRPYFAGSQDAKWRIEGAMNVSSAARAFGQSLKIGHHREDFASLTLLSTTFTSDLRAGAQRPSEFRAFGLRNEYIERSDGADRTVRNANPNVQVGTAYNQYNLLQKLRFRLHEAVELNANFQYSTTSNVPRYDALTERGGDRLRWARWDYGPQTRALAALKLSDRRGTRLYDVANYLLSYQAVGEDRITRLANDPNEENNLERVATTNLQTDFSLNTGRIVLRYGFDLRYDQVSSEAFIRNLDNGTTDQTSVNTRYPSQGSRLFSGGAYAEADREFGSNWRLRGGLRWNRQRLLARFGEDDPIEWPQAYLDGITNTESAVTAALGALHDVNASHWRLLFAQGFRAPNVDDFAKFRENNGFILVPNPNLQPERSNTLEAGYRYVPVETGFRAGVTVYHTWLDNAIIRRGGTLPDGSVFLMTGGGRLGVQTNANAESARVYGFDVNVSKDFASGWRMATDFHYLRGLRKQLTVDGEVLTLPQDHIPPPYGSASAGWADGPWDLSFRLRYQFAKRPEDYAVGQVFGNETVGYVFDRTGTADNLEYTPLASDGHFNYTGAYGWWTANLYAEYKLNDHFTFRLKGENLLDRHYRTFASGVSAAGIDLGIGVTAEF